MISIITLNTYFHDKEILFSMILPDVVAPVALNTLRPRRNGCHFPDAIFKWIFLNENVWISINISLKFVPGGPINNIPTLVQVMAWRRPGDKPLYEPMMVRLPTHICVTGLQWVYVCTCVGSVFHPFLHVLESLTCFNSLWLSDAIWWHRSGSTLAKVMACCLMAPSH